MPRQGAELKFGQQNFLGNNLSRDFRNDAESGALPAAPTPTALGAVALLGTLQDLAAIRSACAHLALRKKLGYRDKSSRPSALCVGAVTV